MKKREFNELTRSKGVSQEELADKLHIPVELIREWLKGESLPCSKHIQQMAIILQQAPEYIFDLFKPETHAAKAYEDKEELLSLMYAIFHNIEDPQDLIDLCFMSFIRNSRGIIASSDGMAFSFNKVLSRMHGNTLIFSDESENIVVLGRNNMISVKPLHTNFNTFTAVVTVNIPVFPIDEKKFNPESFRQEIFIACKKEDK